MNLLASYFSNRFSPRVFISAAICVLIGCAALCLTLTMQAQQSSGPRAIVRRGLTVNGRIEGSVQQLSGENATANGGGVLTGDLLVPGTPTVRQSGHPTFGGTVQGSGSAQPSNYQIMLNGNAQLGRVITRTDPVAMPPVDAPPQASGTRDVTLNSAGQSVGDFSTVRDLTLNGNVGMVAVPSGTYRRFTANGGSGFTLGVAGASQPASYNLNSLTLNGGSRLDVVGPVVLTTASTVTINAAMGSASHPSWLNLKVASGGVTLNGGSTLYGIVSAPTGTVTINGNAVLIGGLACDRLTSNGNGLLRLVDTTPPVVIVQQPADGLLTNAAQVTVTGTFSDESATTITVNGNAASIIGNSFSAPVPLTEGSNSLLIVAVDSAGNRSQTTLAVTRDSTPPVVALTSKDTITNASQFTVAGTVTEANQATVTINGVVAALNGNSFSTVEQLNEGANSFLVVVTDGAGNRIEATQIVTRDTVSPVLNVVAPVNGFITDDTVVAVFGQVTDATRVAVSVNDTSMVTDGNSFGGQVELPEGVNQVHVIATDAAGNRTEIIHTVTSDATEPVITDLTPAEGTVIDGTSAIIQGRVIDATAVAVKVGSVTTGVGADGHFTLTQVPIVEGDNELKITATDVAGNTAEAELLLKGKDLTPPAVPLVFPALSPTRLSFQSIEGRSEPGSKIKITGGVEPAQTNTAFGTGLFVVNVKLATGTNALEVTSTDAAGNVSSPMSLSITSDPELPQPPAGQAAHIYVASGDAQRGLVGAELPRPLIAIVKDRDSNPVSNAAVNFTITQGGGRFINGSSSVVVQTDGNGDASVVYISGNAPGVQLIRADFPGDTLAPTTFMAETLQPAPGGATAVIGSVTDLNLRALPNVLVRLGGQQTRTGIDGHFRIENVPAGPHQLLELIGRDQISLPGRWPNISYDMDVLPGIENSLGRQLFLPKVNEGVALPLDGNNVVTQDTSVQLAVAGGEPPITITARAGTHVTFPPDVTDKRLSVTRIPSNRVPMPLEDGLATNLFISVQPSGAIFDQPLEVSFPNVDRLAPGSEVMLMSFDHDAGRYVRVGSGKVSADGRSVASNPGSGIRIGAWHALPGGGRGGNPPSEVTVLGQIKIEGNADLEGRHIDDIMAQYGGNRAVTLTDRAHWHDSEEIALRVRYVEPGGGAAPSAAGKYIDAKLVTRIPDVTLEEVSFQHNYALRPDDGGDSYKKPHWQKPATPDPKYKGEPVAYVAGRPMELSAKFRVAEEITKPALVKVKADGNDNYDLEADVTKPEVKDKVFEMKFTAVKTAFAADTIDYFESMDFAWKLSFDNGNQWLDAGSSNDQMYVTLSSVGRAYHTRVHLATAGLKGMKRDNKAGIIGGIWSAFASRSICHATDQCSTADAFKYWGAISSQDPGEGKPEYFSTDGLLKNGDGRCGAWQAFFIDVLKVQGINAEQFNIVPKDKSGYMTPDVISLLIVKPIPAQGNPSPQQSFSNHALVLVENQLYDPSYGAGPFAGANDEERLRNWENASLAEVQYYKSRSDAHPFGQPNTPDKTETKKYKITIGVSTSDVP